MTARAISREVGRAGEAVHERDAVDEDPGGEHTEDEELQRRFVRARVQLAQAGDHERGGRDELERDEQHQQVAARRHQQQPRSEHSSRNAYSPS